MDHIPICPQLTHSGKKESQTPKALYESGGSKAKEPVCVADHFVFIASFCAAGIQGQQADTNAAYTSVGTSTTDSYSTRCSDACVQYRALQQHCTEPCMQYQLLSTLHKWKISDNTSCSQCVQ